MKYSKEFKNERKESLGVNEYSRQYLWGCYVKWQVKQTPGRTFEKFCKGWLNQ